MSKSEPKQRRQPGHEHAMRNKPEYIRKGYRGSGRLAGKVAVISGGDSGIGRAVAVHFAREGAATALLYLEEQRDARETKRLVEREGARCLLVQGDIGDESFCQSAIAAVIDHFGRLDVVVNNAAEQHSAPSLEEIDAGQLERTFRTNFFGYFFLTRAALPHLRAGAAIVNTTSVTAYRGSEHLIDYSATKGAIVALTRSLSQALVERGIRVNGVAPGPIWTPLIPASFDAKALAKFGKDTPMKRPGQPSEVAPAFVFLASADASYITGQVIHPNGGDFVAT
jgi:NAD(P)-dependent dehydrogenase (short-subunit alcohol dehydrogenase family)